MQVLQLISTVSINLRSGHDPGDMCSRRGNAGYRGHVERVGIPVLRQMKQVKGDELMARITAERLIRHLERSGFVVMKKPPIKSHSAP